jgi:Ca2+-binding RTX toxin-like protein
MVAVAFTRVSTSELVSRYDAAAGENNHLQLVQKDELLESKTTVLIRDSAGIDFSDAAGCNFVQTNVAECSLNTFLEGPPKVVLNLGNGIDSVVGDFVSLPTPAGFGPLETSMTVHGGPGPDTVTGTSNDDLLNGGDGDDDLDGEAGEDHLNGMVGDDALDGGPDDDEAEGGIGRDTVDGFAGEDELRGGDGDDTVRGGLDDDTVNGEGGNDTVNGGAGEDELFGGSEADNINSVDTAADSVDCGTNLFAKDIADIDGLDSAIRCEKIL